MIWRASNLPYLPDAGASCGAGFVNGGNQLDGVSIVEGHEYAETITDQFPAGGWTDNTGAENGDKCAWISSGQGASQNISLTTGTFAVQSNPCHGFGFLDVDLQRHRPAGGAVDQQLKRPHLGHPDHRRHRDGDHQSHRHDRRVRERLVHLDGERQRQLYGQQLLGNPGFETGSSAPWTMSAGMLNNSSNEPAHTGIWDAWLDGYGTTHTDQVAQTVTIPTGCTNYTFVFWLHVDTAETTTTTTYDRLSVQHDASLKVS